MTRKDHIKLAAALKWVKPLNPLGNPKTHEPRLEAMFLQWKCTVNSIAQTLESDNSSFDVVRFKAACND